ncbi:MAG: ribonuclease III [Nitrospirae bacterium]|uniref:ribonuclease III n=1 Tax=Candidatus Magnetobacterium casense TaxID=1455061 RepID=UPI00138E3B3F|nr:ribonuclease III [Candidatus Magnetobacterium casensis]MBF0336505.1 ribonuclease III [Nitrospirota bacterium]
MPKFQTNGQSGQPSIQSEPVDSGLETLEGLLNYTFRDKGLLIEALTHRSYFHESPGKSCAYNERFEFLGDAVLGMAITDILFRENASLSEAEMSKLKSYLVSRDILAQLALEMNIGQYIRLGKGEELTGGRKKNSLIANTLEAIIGAVYLDSDYVVVKNVIAHLYASTINKAINQHHPYDYKTTLQELSQTLFATLPEYRLVSETGDDHNKTFVYEVCLNAQPLATGTGKSKKTAQINAACAALQTLHKKENLI